MRRFAWKAALFLPLLLAIFAINLFVDPAGIFFQRQEKEIAARLLEGYNVVNAENVDSRQVLRYYVRGLHEPKDLLVFGSSRSMVLDSSFFPGRTLFNASAPAASLRDVVANFEVFHERGLIPKQVLISVDPHVFNKHCDNRMYLHPEFRRALRRLGLSDLDETYLLARWVDRRYAQVISPAYFQVAFGAFLNLIQRGPSVVEFTTDPIADHKLVHADGSLSYERIRRERVAEDVDRKAVRFAEKHPEELANYYRLDPGLRRIFETFLDSLQAEGVSVELLLVPYHPGAYGVLMANDAYRIIGNVESYVKDCAKARGIPVFGSFDPAPCGFVGTDFYDAVHAKAETLRKLFPGQT